VIVSSPSFEPAPSPGSALSSPARQRSSQRRERPSGCAITAWPRLSGVAMTALLLWSGVPHDLVGDEREAVADGARADEAHRLLVARLAEEALAGPEHDGEDDQPHFVDQVVL
jgi:hypothetical protein